MGFNVSAVTLQYADVRVISAVSAESVASYAWPTGDADQAPSAAVRECTTGCVCSRTRAAQASSMSFTSQVHVL